MAEGYPQAGASPGEPHPGRRLGNRFELHQRLKVGRGISTWLGSDLRSGARVVVKVASAVALVPTARHRLEHEAEVLRELDSPFLVPVLHLGTSGELLYLVTPYVPGEPLEDRLGHEPLSVTEALTLAQCVLAALAEAHRHGVLHRDVKPSNIIVEERPLVRATLIDFGLARSERLDPSLRDLPGGTARYLSPEQAGLINRPVEATSDLYSLGAVLFEALAGRPAFDGSSVGEVLRQHLAARPKLRSVRVEVPRALEELISRLLQTDPQDRYQSAESVLADVRAIEEALAHGQADPELVTGAHDMRRSLTEPSFVGRHEELAQLERELERTRTEPGRLVVLEGESGGGKSRLLEEFAARATQHGAWVLQGQATDHAAQRPFQIFAGVAATIASAALERPALAEQLRERLAGQEMALCTVLPQFEPVLRPDPQQRLGPESLGESRGISALTALLGALGTSEQPALLILEDSQWADELTQRVLESISHERRSARGHVMLVVSFRSEEVEPTHVLRRLSPTATIRLTPFGVAEVASLAESMAGALPPEATELVARLSEGNPFMASAVLHGLVEDGALVPGPTGWEVHPEAMAHVRSSRQAAAFLVRRVKLLPPDALRLLSVGAVLGKSFDLLRVAALSGTPREGVVAALEEPRRRHMLWEEQGRYTFVHDKLREVLLGLLFPEERKELHRLAAKTATAAVPSDPFELAYHFDAAGEYAQALPYALVAAERARQQFALETAELNYRIAERGAAGAEAGLRHRIAAGLGEVLMLRGRYDEAQQQLERALSLAHDRMEQVRTHGTLGELAFKRGDVGQANTYLEKGLVLLGRWVPPNSLTIGLSALWEVLVQAAHTLLPHLLVGRRPLEGHEADLVAVHLYSRLAYGYWYRRGRAAVLWAHLRELNIAERYPPTPELAQAYSEHSPVLTTLPWFQRAYAYVEKSLTLRQEMGDVWGQGQSLHFYGLALYVSSRFSECIERCREAMRLLERTGDRWEMNNAHYHLAMALYRLGELREAMQASQRLHDVALAIGDRYSLGLSLDAWSKASGGRIPRSLLEAELANPNTSDAQTYAGILQAEAIRLLREGDAQGAVDALERAQQVAERAHLRSEYVAPIAPWLATALRQLAESASPLHPARRQALLKRAQRVARQAHAMARVYRNNLPHALRERGLLAAMAGHSQRGRRWLEQSLRIAEELKMKHERAQTLLARGQLGKALGWAGATHDLETAARELETLEQDIAPELGERRNGGGTLSLVDRFPRVLDAGRRIASALSREAVFDAVRQSILELLRAEHCVVMDPRALLPDDEAAAQGVSRTAVARALETGRAAVMGQGLPGGMSESMELLGVRSLLAAPIQVRGRTVAVVCASHRQVGELFGEDEERLAEFVTVLGGAALENAESYARIAALSEEQGRLYREEQEAVRRRDDFLSIAAHELKTPLTSLQLHIQGLQTQLKNPERVSPEKLTNKLESANAQTQRMGRLVNDLLDISRIAQGQLHIKREDVDLVQVVRGTLERSREALASAQCPVELRAPATPLVGCWDAMRLEQVVSNLLTNAMKYGAGKPIEVTVEASAHQVRLRVRDHGIGIAEEDRARIFERFERAVSVRHYGGFGIGLWIVREIIQALGGNVEVESTPGQGSTFTVTLPLQPPAPVDA